MSTNKHAQIRYSALDKCFSNKGRRYAIEELTEACNQAIYDHSGHHDGVKRRQVYDDIRFMESEQGWSIHLEKTKSGRSVYYRYADTRYSINQSPVSHAELVQIQEVLHLLSRFQGMPQFEWINDIAVRLQSLSRTGAESPAKIIDFEQNQFVKGLDLISPLFNAIVNKRVLRILYEPFHTSDQMTFDIHPYYIKQYNLRWFLFGITTSQGQITNLPLDRIISIEELPGHYIPNRSIDFRDYFEDLIGVTHPKGAVVERIVLFISRTRWPYILTKPIHGSQRTPRPTANGVIIDLDLIINPELVSRILSYGKDVLVLEPSHLVEQIESHLTSLVQYYLNNG